MKPMKTTFVWLAAISVSIAAAAPALADYTYGCTLPMIPKPERLLDRTLDARELVNSHRMVVVLAPAPAIPA